MRSEKQNCWEYMNCGREPGGDKVAELGICQAASDESFNGINFGTNGGRICWALVGTFCGGEIQGTFAKQLDACTQCDFYKSAQV